MTRDWKDLGWLRLLIAACLAPLPAIYIGFGGATLALSDGNLAAIQRVVRETSLYAWCFAALFTLLYLNLISRFRRSVGEIECIAVGAAGAFLLAEAFFLAVEMDLLGPVPYMVFFPGLFMSFFKDLLIGGALLGAILAPAGAVSGWIFWRIGVAPAVPRSDTSVF
jgi:hypothetical protein